MTSPSLSVTIVTFSPCLPTLNKTLNSLSASIKKALQSGALGGCNLMLVDNGPGSDWQPILTEMLNQIQQNTPTLSTRILSGHGNIGFGCGHNLAARTRKTDYLLILNPDVILAEDALSEALHFMGSHKDVGLLSPNVVNMRGTREFLCKRYPSVLALGLRGFAPTFLKQRFEHVLADYEMRNLYSKGKPEFDIPIVSGCFMFCRYASWKKIKGFSTRYFMYFEDFDFSLRIREITRIAYVPDVRITHLGGDAARKGWRHISMFMRSALAFFNQHGWRLW